MKSYNHLYEELVSYGNIILAIRNSSRGKRRRRDVRRYVLHIDEPLHPDNIELVEKIQKDIAHYRNDRHHPKEIYDGITRKKRTIIVPTYREQIVHHAVVNILKPIFFRGMYEHSYGSLPDRGSHKGAKYIRKWIRRDPKGCKYCLKMDIRKFFDSIPHDILKSRLRELIRDQRFLLVVETIIDAQKGARGIPLGFYTSQWIANWYLSGLDHYIKEDLKADHYIRYMDDMVIFGPNKRRLHRIRQAVDDYLRQNLGLELNQKWQVYRFDWIDRSGKNRGRDLDFMGFRFFRNRTILRRTIMLKATRKAARIAGKERYTVHDCRQMLSYNGWIDATDTYRMYEIWIKPNICLQQIKRRISRYDKRVKEQNHVDKEQERAETSVEKHSGKQEV